MVKETVLAQLIVVEIYSHHFFAIYYALLQMVIPQTLISLALFIDGKGGVRIGRTHALSAFRSFRSLLNAVIQLNRVRFVPCMIQESNVDVAWPAASTSLSSVSCYYRVALAHFAFSGRSTVSLTVFVVIKNMK